MQWNLIGKLGGSGEIYSITELFCYLCICVTFASMVRSDTNTTRTSLFVCRPTRLNTSHVMKGQYLISSSFQTLTFSSQPRAKWFREYFLQNKQSNAVIYNSNCTFQNDRTRKHMNRNNEIIVYNYYNEYVIVLKCTSHKFHIQNYKHSESFRIEDSFSDNR